MKFKIHVERNGMGLVVEDTFVVYGDTEEECQQQAQAFLEQRGLQDANVWSEELQ